MVAIVRLLVISCACLLGGTLAHAVNICAVGIKPKIWVGNVATDSKCGANTIQAAIDAADCPNTQIIITGEHTYTEQKLTIVNKSVSLVGSTGLCGADAESSTVPVRTISGTTSGSVIAIGGSSDVTLQYLEITGGGNENNHNSEGGGIFFGGSGSLTLQADTIDRNQADYGGGIDVSPTGSATLTLLADTLILNNTAGTSGGGIRIEGQTRLFMLTDSSTVSFNDAVFGYGGGIEILGPARADIGSSGDVFVGAVSENKATDGGGIAVIATSNGNAAARLFSTNASTPVMVSSNSASGQGGGVYVQADGDGNEGTTSFLCGYDFRIDQNTAPDGAAIYATDAQGDGFEGVEFNTGQCGPEPTAALGAVACAANTPCNEISGNAAEDAQGNRSDGSVININNYDFFHANRVTIRQNSGAQIINLTDALGVGYMHNCLIVDNQSTGEVIRSNDADADIDNCTIANNTIDDGYVIFAISGLTVSNDLIAQPSNSTLDYQPQGCSNCLIVNNIISSELFTLGAPGGSLSSSAPLFVDDTNSEISKRDYHLQAFVRDGVVTASPAIDFAPVISGEGNDLDNNSRGQDVPLVANRFGTSDVGAYEMQPIADRIFADAFGDATSLVH